MLKQDLSGKRVVITGANSGIGFEAAKTLSRMGAEVILAVRNEQKGDAAKKAIQKESKQTALSVMKLDLADLASVREFANRYQSLSKR